MMYHINKLLLYAGLDRQEFNLLAADARQTNAKNLNAYSLVAILVFALLVVANALFGVLTAINQKYYVLMLAVSLLIGLGSRFLVPKYPGLTLPLFYAFMAMLYAFSLVITAIHPTLPAVTTIVLLFAVPFLMYDRPIRLAMMTAAVVAALGLVSFAYKPVSVARDDLWNGVTFAVVAIAGETLQQRSKFLNLSQARKIRLLSETDLLTGVKNRNHYENQLGNYAVACQENLVCVYVDVNGLHELNNTKGHKAGDEMLKAVAGALADSFGADNTYRIGGDEFVCFRKDAPEDAVNEMVNHASAQLAARGYNISAGVCSQLKSELDLSTLTCSAENAMFQAKRAFYAQTGRDRRRR